MQELFKGYVPTKNKQCMMPFKNRTSEDLMTYEQVSSLPEYAGILADDTILIDIDDEEQSEILMKIVEDKQLACRVTQTKRGKHFFFMNASRLIERCGNHKTLACGLTADIKVGCKSSYSILKHEGKERKVIYDIYEDESYQEVPKWLMPIATKTRFIEMESGDGRNQSLFEYILTLQSNDFSVEESRECLKIINEYVIKEPLSESELETITRDEAFQKPIFFSRNKFLFDKFAYFIKNNNHIIKINGQLHIYKDGIYVNAIDEIESKMIEHISDLSRSKRAEVMAYLNLIIQENAEPAPANYIAFKNGIYDIINDEMLEFSPEIIITNQIPFNYMPDAYSEIVDRTLDKLACNDDNIRDLLEECVGYCFYRRSELRKSFVLTGEKENGKSTFLSMLNNLLGRHNVSNLDLEELGSRFKTAELFGKLANIGDDIADSYISNPAIFKKLSSGNPINAERKGQDPFDFSNYAKLIFSANEIPRIKDKSGAVLSRLVIIPFNARFTKKDPDYDPYIKYKLITDEAMEYLILLGIDGLKRVLENQAFTTSEKVQRALVEYNENNNPILLYMKEEPKIINETTSSVYQDYYGFCVANNYQPLSNIEFSKQIKKAYNVEVINKTIGGKKCRIFVEKEGKKRG